MELFSLPPTTKISRVIPKNAFDAYINAKQKKLFTDLISRITWTHKLSPDTVNLQGKDLQEIQLFKIELKQQDEIKEVLDIIDRAIPYHIIFIVEHDGMLCFSTSSKHPHPVKEDTSVIDWTFRSGWFSASENKYILSLKKNLDVVYQDFCTQLSGKVNLQNKPLQELVEYEKHIAALQKEIAKLKTSVANCKQFNRKVELNIKLNAREMELLKLENNEHAI